MKNKNKIWLISIGCIGFGIVLLIAGLILGGRPGFYVSKDGIHPVDEVISDSAYVQEKSALDEFASMDISVNDADIEIKPSNGYYLEYKLNGSYAKPLVEVKNKKLSLKEGKWGGMLGFNLFNFNSILQESEHYQVTVYVPKDVYFQTVTLSNDDGDINLDEISASFLQIDNDYGEVNIGTFKGEKLTTDMDDGDITVGLLDADRVDIVNDYGDCNIDIAKGGTLSAEMDDGRFIVGQTELASLKIQNDYGEVRIGLAKEMEAYDLDLETDYGEIKIPGYEDVSFGEDEKQFKTNNQSENRINVSCDDGDIIITEKK